MSRPVQTLLRFAVPDNDAVETIMGRTPSTDLLRPADIASAMDVSVSLVQGWMECGALPSIDISRADSLRAHRRVSRTVFRAFLEKRATGVAP